MIIMWTFYYFLLFLLKRDVQVSASMPFDVGNEIVHFQLAKLKYSIY